MVQGGLLVPRYAQEHDVVNAHMFGTFGDSRISMRKRKKERKKERLLKFSKDHERSMRESARARGAGLDICRAKVDCVPIGRSPQTTGNEVSLALWPPARTFLLAQRR